MKNDSLIKRNLFVLRGIMPTNEEMENIPANIRNAESYKREMIEEWAEIGNFGFQIKSKNHPHRKRKTQSK